MAITGPHGSQDRSNDDCVAERPWPHQTPLPVRLPVGGEPPADNSRGQHAVLRREAIFRRTLAFADMLAAAMALALSVSLSEGGFAWLTLLTVPLIIVASKANGLYDRDGLLLNKTTLDEAPALFQCATLCTLLVVLVNPTISDSGMGAREIVVLWGALAVFGLAARHVARRACTKLTDGERCLFVGSDASYERLRVKLANGGTRASIVGRMVLPSHAEPVIAGDLTQSLHALIADLQVHRVIIEPSDELPTITLDFIREAKTSGLRISLLPRVLEVVGAAIAVDDIEGLALLGVSRFGMSRSNRRLKRGFDIAFATLGLLCMTPLLALIAALIKLDSPGRVIFRQTRIGRDGIPFEIWKFRTMVSGADEMKAQLGARNQAAAGLFKIHDDPRVTRVGRWLRRTSLDELPQFVNVLKGQMSIVGPRPLILDEDCLITGLDRRRLYLTPGMTGRWQIGGSSRIPLAEMVKLDYLYVANWSLWTDVTILLRTVPYVLRRRGV